MKVFLSDGPGGVLVLARAEGGGALGDLAREVRPGEDLWGVPYERLAALGDGPHEIGPAGDEEEGARRVELSLLEGLPDRLLPVPDVPQRESFDCGSAAAMSACRLFGVGPEDEAEYVRRIPSDPENGTPPSRLIDFFTAEGLGVRARQQMTLDDLRRHWQLGEPVLCCVQDYASGPKEIDADESGHWVVAVGLWGGFVFAQDPSATNLQDDSGTDAAPGLVMIPEEKWLRVWHDKDGAGTPFVRYGIAVSAPAAPPGPAELALPAGASDGWELVEGDEGGPVP